MRIKWKKAKFNKNKNICNRYVVKWDHNLFYFFHSKKFAQQPAAHPFRDDESENWFMTKHLTNHFRENKPVSQLTSLFLPHLQKSSQDFSKCFTAAKLTLFCTYIVLLAIVCILHYTCRHTSYCFCWLPFYFWCNQGTKVGMIDRQNERNSSLR